MSKTNKEEQIENYLTVKEPLLQYFNNDARAVSNFLVLMYNNDNGGLDEEDGQIFKDGEVDLIRLIDIARNFTHYKNLNAVCEAYNLEGDENSAEVEWFFENRVIWAVEGGDGSIYIID